MFSQKLRHVEDDELRIDIDPCYEADPYELKLDEMIDAEPEPEVIEGFRRPMPSPGGSLS